MELFTVYIHMLPPNCILNENNENNSINKINENNSINNNSLKDTLVYHHNSWKLTINTIVLLNTRNENTNIDDIIKNFEIIKLEDYWIICEHLTKSQLIQKYKPLRYLPVDMYCEFKDVMVIGLPYAEHKTISKLYSLLSPFELHPFSTNNTQIKK